MDNLKEEYIFYKAKYVKYCGEDASDKSIEVCSKDEADMITIYGQRLVDGLIVDEALADIYNLKEVKKAILLGTLKEIK